MKAIAQTRLVAMIRSDAQRFEALKREIVHLDYFCKGTVLKRMMKCGNKKCACHRDPAKRHGPYFECTYKVQNKTVNLKLYPEMTPLYRDRKSTRLNSSHQIISYAVFCLKKKKKKK